MSKKSFLKGLIFKEEETSVTENKETTSGPPTSVNSPVLAPPPQTLKGVADNKFIDMLEKLIEENNLPGQDYFEFKQSVENMKNIPMDEKTKFLTVYQVLSLQGCKKDVLLLSLDKYIGIIQQEKINFEAEMKEEYKSSVQAKLNKAEEAKKELESLTKRMSELNTTIQTLSQEAQSEEMKLSATASNFNASADVIIGAMIADKDKIANYIIIV